VKRAVTPRVPRHEVDPDDLWTSEEARRFLAYAEEQDSDTAALVRLALDSGARLGELLALTWPDIDTTKGTVRIRRSVSQKRLPGDERMLRFDTPKSDKSRTLELDASTIAALRQVRDRQKAEGGRCWEARRPASHTPRTPAVATRRHDARLPAALG
jgi:integrase